MKAQAWILFNKLALLAFHQLTIKAGSAVPMNYIIDRDGKVVDAWYGGGREHPKAIVALQKLGGELAEAIEDTERDPHGREIPPGGEPVS